MNARPRFVLLYALFFLSGAAGLGSQMAWVKMFSAGLGHEVPAMLAVTTAFLGGMALGAWLLGGRVDRSANAARWYGALEIIIGAWVLLSALFIPAVNRLALTLTGDSPSAPHQWAVVFVLPFLALLPATMAMGATLPAMERFISAMRGDGRWVGAIYAVNTLGAAVGTLGGVFVLMPALGFRASLICLAALNLACGAAAFTLGRSVGADVRRLSKKKAAGTKDSVPPHAVSRTGPISLRRIGITVVFTGLLGIGFQLAGVRVLSQVLENTVYTYAASLTVYLTGTAAGAAFFKRYGGGQTFDRTLRLLLWSAATTCLLGTSLMHFAPAAYDRFRDAFGDSTTGVLAAEFSVAAMIFVLPTVLMGATFSLLVQAARSMPGGVGRAAALNTFGCALAALVTGLWLLPALGTKWTLIVLSLGYLLLLPQTRGLLAGTAVAGTALAFAALARLQIVDLPQGGTVTAYREGAMSAVAVVQTPDGHRSLRVNNRLQMGGTAAALAERRQAHIPLLLHTKPHRALFLGPGTGITLGASAAYPDLKADGVELVPEVVELMSHFKPENEDPLTKPNLRVLSADARRFVRATTNRYDVIVADLFHPGHDGAGFLYTREHFQAVRERLNPDGLFCQWLPLHQLDEFVLRSIVRTFTGTFSQSQAFLLHFNVDIPALALIGSAEPLRLPPDWFERRLANAELRSRLRDAGLDRPLNLLGCFAAGPDALRRFAGDAPVSTDNHPVVLFAAPWFTVRRHTSSHELLLTFLNQCEGGAKEFVKGALPGSEEGLAKNLADFVAARDVYLKGLVEEGAGRLPEAMEAYLSSARRSLFFTPAYARMVTIIQVMAASNREQARELFQRLEAAQPAQPLGRKLLAPLFEEGAGER